MKQHMQQLLEEADVTDVIHDAVLEVAGGWGQTVGVGGGERGGGHYWSY